MSPDIGTLLHKRYRLIERIGKGGAGEVFKAVDTQTGRSVAVKLALTSRMTTGSENREILLERFAREARVLARLNHPNTVQLLDFGTEDDACFLVMEYLDGPTLGSLMKRLGRIAEPTALAIAIRIGRSLEQAHQIGVLHRDIKPANVILVPCDDSTFLVKVFDFGLVKALATDEERSLTEQDKFVGTPSHMAPECISSSPVGVGVDIYSLGVVMYKMLSGRLPFLERNPMRLVFAHCQTPPPSLSQVSGPGQVTEETASIVMRCLAKRPNARWSSARELVEQLEERFRVIARTDPLFKEELTAAMADERKLHKETEDLNDAPTITLR